MLGVEAGVVPKEPLWLFWAAPQGARFDAGRRGQLYKGQEGSERGTVGLHGRNAGTAGASEQVGSTCGIYREACQERNEHRHCVWNRTQRSEEIGAVLRHLKAWRSREGRSSDLLVMRRHRWIGRLRISPRQYGFDQFDGGARVGDLND